MKIISPPSKRIMSLRHKGLFRVKENMKTIRWKENKKKCSRMNLQHSFVEPHLSPQVSSSSKRKFPNTHCHIRRLMLHSSSIFFSLLRTKVSCFLSLGLVFARHLSLFQCAFGVTFSIVHYNIFQMVLCTSFQRSVLVKPVSS